jgi:hypothetical protein
VRYFTVAAPAAVKCFFLKKAKKCFLAKEVKKSLTARQGGKVLLFGSVCLCSYKSTTTAPIFKQSRELANVENADNMGVSVMFSIYSLLRSHALFGATVKCFFFKKGEKMFSCKKGEKVVDSKPGR